MRHFGYDWRHNGFIVEQNPVDSVKPLVVLNVIGAVLSLIN